MRPFLVGVAVTGALVACSSVNDVSVAAQLSLDQHQAKWEERTFPSYSFDLVQEKFGRTTNVHITVNGTTIVSVIDKDTGLPSEFDTGWPTIDELFANAQIDIRSRDVTLQMEFNEQYGYPTVIAVNSTNPGGPYTAQVSNLAPLVETQVVRPVAAGMVSQRGIPRRLSQLSSCSSACRRIMIGVEIQGNVDRDVPRSTHSGDQPLS